MLVNMAIAAHALLTIIGATQHTNAYLNQIQPATLYGQLPLSAK